MERLETLLQKAEEFADPVARDTTREIVQALMDLHGEALVKILDHLSEAGEPGRAILDSLGRDPAVAGVLMLYDLHPTDLDTRVRAALAKVRPSLREQGVDVELIDIDGDTVRLRLTHEAGRPPNPTLERIVEEAIVETAPDIIDVEIEVGTGPSPGRLSLPLVADRPAPVNGGQRPALPAFTTRHLEAEPDERCELCGRGLAPDHEHLLEPAARRLLCSCEACALLFGGQQDQRYRRVPRDVEYLADFRLTDKQWQSFLIPINLAFFSYQSTAGRVVALYPSPAGATESLLELETWQALVEDNPVLRSLQPDVEALLVNRTQGACDHYRVSIAECYKFVGLIRSRWRGLSGGEEVWEAVGRFFQSLKERSRG
jgi:hypothetical protein